MRASAKKLLMIAMLLGGFCLVTRADYESQRWTIGQYPHRVGIIGINGEWTSICLGQEHGWVDGAWGPYYLHVHPYVYLAMVLAPLSIGVAFFVFRGYRLRHVSAA